MFSLLLTSELHPDQVLFFWLKSTALINVSKIKACRSRWAFNVKVTGCDRWCRLYVHVLYDRRLKREKKHLRQTEQLLSSHQTFHVSDSKRCFYHFLLHDELMKHTNTGCAWLDEHHFWCHCSNMEAVWSHRSGKEEGEKQASAAESFQLSHVQVRVSRGVMWHQKPSDLHREARVQLHVNEERLCLSKHNTLRPECIASNVDTEQEAWSDRSTL